MAGKGLNKVTLIGNLGADPEVRYTPDNRAIANINLATGESWKDKNTGERREKTEWHRVVFFGRLAEVVGEYLRKGSKVYIEGRLQTRKWQDKEQNDRYTTEIVVDITGQMIMLDSRSEGTASLDEQEPSPSPQSPQTSSSPPQSPTPKDDNFDDDIPF